MIVKKNRGFKYRLDIRKNRCLMCYLEIIYQQETSVHHQLKIGEKKRWLI